MIPYCDMHQEYFYRKTYCKRVLPKVSHTLNPSSQRTNGGTISFHGNFDTNFIANELISKKAVDTDFTYKRTSVKKKRYVAPAVLINGKHPQKWEEYQHRNSHILWANKKLILKLLVIQKNIYLL